MTAVAKKQRAGSPRKSDRARGVVPALETAAQLLAWYDAERRELPWRCASTEPADPYRVWLSEIMLQQTTVKAVIPYYDRFLARFPTVRSLAKADLEEVLKLWAGLGYYSRARNLHACARLLVKRHRGRFPSTEAGLRELPGIGPYTAAAVAAIAFGEVATPVDGNVERVVARLFAIAEPLPGVKPELRRRAAELTPQLRPGDFAQAMMDLGATVCTPKRPSCLMCPLASGCAGRAQGIADTLPRKQEKGVRPTRFGVAFLALREDGHVLLRERPPTGLLAGMLEVPSTEWGDALPAREAAMRVAPVRADWWPVPERVVHVFTHFRLELAVYHAIVPADASLNLWASPDRCRWVPRSRLAAQALPSLMRKVIAHAMRST